MSYEINHLYLREKNTSGKLLSFNHQLFSFQHKCKHSMNIHIHLTYNQNTTNMSTIITIIIWLPTNVTNECNFVACDYFVGVKYWSIEVCLALDIS